MSSYATVAINGNVVGHAFTSRWTVNGKTVCWITQLVVHCDFRQQGLATKLLSHIRSEKDDVYGIMSSHPAACLAAVRAFCGVFLKFVVVRIYTNTF
jgi:ribosomal protein S18 acetylase RimI-like enzyme